MILVGMYNDVVNFQLLFLDFNCSRPVEYHAIFSILKQRKKGKTNIVTKRLGNGHLLEQEQEHIQTDSLPSPR